MKRRSTTIIPSGAVLPMILRMKYNDLVDTATDDDQKRAKLPVYPLVDKDDENQVFSVEELEQKMMQASSVMMEIQKQLYRGEEGYVEETHAHGNLFRGWDAFIDLKDVGGHHAGMAPQPGTSRRIPTDNRWFSGSCTSIARSGYHNRPHSRMSSRASTPSMLRSGNDTPVSMVSSHSQALEEVSLGVVEAPLRDIPDVTAPGVTSTPPTADVTSLSQPAAAVPITTELLEDVIAMEDSTIIKSDEMQSTPTAATPLRRGSTRKRKQGES
jgi:Histone acetyltransferase subunit NuA4